MEHSDNMTFNLSVLVLQIFVFLFAGLIDNIEVMLKICVQLTSVGTFFIFILINWDKIESNWNRIKQLFKKDGTK